MGKQLILVGFDGSESGHKALEAAKDVARHYQADLKLLHVIDWSPFELQTIEENEHQARERRAQIKRDREELFPEVIEALEKEGISATADVLWGHPAEVLADQADELDAGMIVIGRVGQSRLKSLLFGSVASRTVQLADCPVLVVP